MRMDWRPYIRYTHTHAQSCGSRQCGDKDMIPHQPTMRCGDMESSAWVWRKLLLCRLCKHHSQNTRKTLKQQHLEVSWNVFGFRSRFFQHLGHLSAWLLNMRRHPLPHDQQLTQQPCNRRDEVTCTLLHFKHFVTALNEASHLLCNLCVYIVCALSSLNLL